MTASLDATLLCAGVCRVPEAFVVPRGRLRRVDVPVLVALLRHPREGVGLFDTGCSPRFFDETRRYPYRIYRHAIPLAVGPRDTVVAQLAARGIAAADVRWIVLSHLDPDHAGGLADFPSARVFCTEQAFRSVQGLTGLAALLERHLPGHVPAGLRSRATLLPELAGPPLEPMGPTHDLFGDGTVRLVALPGHATGHLGALVQTGPDRRWLLVGDAVWSREALDRGGGVVHDGLASDVTRQRETQRRLAAFGARAPDVAIVPSHCRAAAQELLADPERRRFA